LRLRADNNGNASDARLRGDHLLSISANQVFKFYDIGKNEETSKTQTQETEKEESPTNTPDKTCSSAK
jgi:hypothetical protein